MWHDTDVPYMVCVQVITRAWYTSGPPPSPYMGIVYHIARIFLSPKGKLIIERRLWEREKLFDSIAAMVLRCEALQGGGGAFCSHPVWYVTGPDTEGVVCLAQGKPVVDLASMLSLTPFCIIGE